ncbi:MAG: hypothetical protein ING32_14745 [Curvibacter sp.]|nr:hypothetical protein [Curvibacter sp.]
MKADKRKLKAGKAKLKKNRTEVRHAREGKSATAAAAAAPATLPGNQGREPADDASARPGAGSCWCS